MVPYKAKVEINGTEVLDWTSFSVRSQYGLAEAQFNVEINRPIVITDGSTVTISDGYNASTLTDLITSKPIENVSANSSSKSSSVTINGAGTDVSRKASKKHLFFINEAWLETVCVGYVLREGILYKSDPGSSPYQLEGVAINRLFFEGLPNRMLKDHQIECIITSGISYYDIAIELASRAGYGITLTTPDLPVQKSFQVPADSPYFQAIARLLAKWHPFIYIENGTIIVKDYSGSKQTRPRGSNIVSLSEGSFEVCQWSKATAQNVVDHLVIQGPSRNFTYKTSNGLKALRMKREPQNLSGNTYLITSEEITDDSLGALSRYSPSISSLVGEYSVALESRPKRMVRTTTLVEDLQGEKTVTTKEDVCQYSADDTLTHRVITEYQFHDFDTPLGHTVVEYGRRGRLDAGQSSRVSGGKLTYDPAAWDFAITSVKKVIFGEYVDSPQFVETDIYTWNLMQYTIDSAKKDGTTYEVLSGVMPSHWYDEMGIAGFEEDSGYGAELALYQVERIRFDVVSSSLLRKNRTYTRLFPIPSRKFYSEDVPIKRPNTQTKQVPRSWEYYWKNNALIYYDSGDPPAGDFHPLVTMQEADVVDEPTAREIAYRQFAAGKDKSTSGRVKLVTPIPGIKIGMTVKLPECKKQVFDWNTNTFGEVVDISGGLYWITGHTRTTRYSGSTIASQKRLEVIEEYDLKENY